MAAVLCNGIGKICSGTCDALGTVMSLPFKACGFACDGVSHALKSPFCLYLTVALGLNIPPIIFAGQALASGDGGGCSVAINWLAINAALCLVNMAAAIYISGKIVQPTVEASETTVETKDVEAGGTPVKASGLMKSVTNKCPLMDTTNNTRAKSFSRVRDVLCHDPVVAVYIVIGIIYIVWQSMGFGRMNEAANCGGGLDALISDALMCGFLFISLGAMAFSCSVCCLR